jgi:hypothetical protein
MKAKSLKHLVLIANAYLDMGEVVIRTTKTFINNAKLLNAMEELDSAVKEAKDETLKLHKDALVNGYTKIKEAEEFTEEEVTH